MVASRRQGFTRIQQETVGSAGFRQCDLAAKMRRSLVHVSISGIATFFCASLAIAHNGNNHNTATSETASSQPWTLTFEPQKTRTETLNAKDVAGNKGGLPPVTSRMAASDGGFWSPAEAWPVLAAVSYTHLTLPTKA